VVKSGLQGMTVRGVKKISFWKYEADMDEWVECPNLPASYEAVYLERGFRKSPPEAKPEPRVEAKIETFHLDSGKYSVSESVASGKLDDVAPVKKKRGRPRKKV